MGKGWKGFWKSEEERPQEWSLQWAGGGRVEGALQGCSYLPALTHLVVGRWEGRGGGFGELEAEPCPC